MEFGWLNSNRISGMTRFDIIKAGPKLLKKTVKDNALLDFRNLT
jgi:hypothetical protein